MDTGTELNWNTKNVHPRKLTAGTQKLVVWVDVFPFPRGIFRFQPLIFRVFSYIQVIHPPWNESITYPTDSGKETENHRLKTAGER